MRTTLLVVAAIAGTTYLLGRSAGRPERKRRHYSLYQRAALLWTAPTAVRARRAVKRRSGSAGRRLHH